MTRKAAVVSVPHPQRQRNRLAHSYFDTSHAILAATVDEDLPELEAAARCLLKRAGGS